MSTQTVTLKKELIGVVSQRVLGVTVGYENIFTRLDILETYPIIVLFTNLKE